jgi:hypothetical protein
MNKIISAALLTVVTGATPILFIHPALADRVIYCTPETQTNVSRDPGNYPHAYADGYQDGQESFREGQDYRHQRQGGEFARGFQDGYYNHPYTGQKYVVPDRVVQSTQECNDNVETEAPPPTVIYNNPPPTVIYNNPRPALSIDIPLIIGVHGHRW